MNYSVSKLLSPSSLKKTFIQLGSVLFFIFCLWYLLIRFLEAFNLQFGIDVFDGSLRLLEALYSSRFIPYTDFGFVYMPGLIFITYFSSITIATYFHLVVSLSFLFSTLLIISYYKKVQSLFLSGVLVLLIAVNFQPLTNPFTEVFWLLLLFVCFLYLNEASKKYLYVIGCLSTMLFLLRWDRVFLLGALVLLSSIALIILGDRFKGVHRAQMLALSKALFLGMLCGGILLVLFLLSRGSDLQTALYFIFVVPFKIGPYRSLPLLSSNVFAHAKIIYFFLLLFAVVLVKIILKTFHQTVRSQDLLSLIFPLSVLPLALNRVDVPHFLPLITSLSFVVLYYSAKKEKLFALLLIPLTLYLIHSLIQPTFISAIKMVGKASSASDLLRPIAECEEKVSHTVYNTIFVGRNNYDHYLINYAMLYLIDPTKKPATNYISDEPGLQSSCYDGQEVTADLTSAQKPLLTFIEKTPQPYEPNASSTMKSCQKIETWLTSHKYTIIGYCSVNSAKFEIRQYR